MSVPFSYCRERNPHRNIAYSHLRRTTHFCNHQVLPLRPDKSSILEVGSDQFANRDVVGSLLSVCEHGIRPAPYHSHEGDVFFDVGDDLHLWLLRNRLRVAVNSAEISMVAGVGIRSRLKLLGLSRILSPGDHSRQKCSSETEFSARILGDHHNDGCVRSLRRIHPARRQPLLPNSGGDRVSARDSSISRADLRENG